MRFTHIDVNFDVRYEGHQNCPKILSMNILRVFSDHHLWRQNWHQYLWTSLCQFNFFVNLFHSLGVWFFDIWHLFDNLTFFDILGANHPLAPLPIPLSPYPIANVSHCPCDPLPMWSIPHTPCAPIPHVPHTPVPHTPVGLIAHMPHTPCTWLPPVSLLPMCSIPPVPHCPCGPHWPCAPHPISPCLHISHRPYCSCGPYLLWHGQWGTWAMGPMGNGALGPLGDWGIFAYNIINTGWILTKI